MTGNSNSLTAANMRRLPVGVYLVGLLIFSSLVYAQTASNKLCVAGMQVQGGSSADTKARDALIKSLDKEKADKAHPMEKVPLSVSVPADALAEAKDKGCDYVLTTNQTDSHRQGRVMPIAGSGMANLDTYYVTVDYQLTKVSDGSVVSNGTFKTSDDTGDQNAVAGAMKKIAAKVNEELKKAGK